jgi:hypothetical protein
MVRVPLLEVTLPCMKISVITQLRLLWYISIL